MYILIVDDSQAIFLSPLISRTGDITDWQMFLFAQPSRMTCSFRHILPLLPPYPVTADLKAIVDV